MAILFVQSRTTSSSATLAYSSNNTAGNLLICSTQFTVSGDSQGNTWHSASAFNSQIWYAMNCAAGANTVTITGGGSFPALSIYEFSGAKTTSALDQHSTGSTSASVTTTANGDLIFANRFAQNTSFGTPSVTVNSPWTSAQFTSITNGGTTNLIQDGYDIQSVAGAISNSGWTVNNANNDFGTAIAAFFAAAGGGNSNQLMLMGCGT